MSRIRQIIRYRTKPPFGNGKYTFFQVLFLFKNSFIFTYTPIFTMEKSLSYVLYCWCITTAAHQRITFMFPNRPKLVKYVVKFSDFSLVYSRKNSNKIGYLNYMKIKVIDIQDCNIVLQTGSIVGKRQVPEHMCGKCCSTDLCNNKCHRASKKFFDIKRKRKKCDPVRLT